MKKYIPILSIFILFASCSKEDGQITYNSALEQLSLDDIELSKTVPGQRNCHSMHRLMKDLITNPGLAQKMLKVEQHTNRVISNQRPGNGNGGNGGGRPGGGGGEEPPAPTPYSGTIEIPVVVHVIYNNSLQNISSTQINSQIDVLNEDFNILNADISSVPSAFTTDIGDVDVNFTLDQVIRVSTTATSWSANDAMKYSSNGGSDVVDPANKLNIWVCNLSGGVLGYAQFPGGSSTTDGIVVGTEYFGNTGYVSAPFDKGRSTTHEVGHWLNLRHIWGDGKCKKDDFVGDTPSSDRPNYSCPSYPTVHCKTTDMTMNYMDYTDDACMYMFTLGQVDRMRALFASGGIREDIVIP